MNSPIRVFFFTYYWLIVLIIATVSAIAIIWVTKCENTPGNLVPLCVAALGVIYFVQKQKVDELLIFERLFVRFNERYAGLHAALQEISTRTDSLSPSHLETLDTYFNLCAEEYLFYREGKVLP